jgi:hypothetical protein
VVIAKAWKKWSGGGIMGWTTLVGFGNQTAESLKISSALAWLSAPFGVTSQYG